MEGGRQQQLANQLDEVVADVASSGAYGRMLSSSGTRRHRNDAFKLTMRMNGSTSCARSSAVTSRSPLRARWAKVKMLNYR